MYKAATLVALLASPVAGIVSAVEVVREGASGTIAIVLFEDVAPALAARCAGLAAGGSYDGVVFHRVIEGFMAQTGDVQYGKNPSDLSQAGRGGSDEADLSAEFSELPFDRGVVGMARSQNPNSANSQFFIMFTEYPSLNGQYTVVGRVTEGLDVLEQIKLGKGRNGAVLGAPDYMKSVTVTE